MDPWDTCICPLTHESRGSWLGFVRRDGRAGGQADGCTGGRADGQTGGRADGRKGGWVDWRTVRVAHGRTGGKAQFADRAAPYCRGVYIHSGKLSQEMLAGDPLRL
jgi:hypothetical protein